MEFILSKVEVFSGFSDDELDNDIYSEFSKIFRATISRQHFCLSILQEITVYWSDWFYFPVVFSEVFGEA